MRKILGYAKVQYKTDQLGNVKLPEFNLFFQTNVLWHLEGMGFSRRQIKKIRGSSEGYCLIPQWVRDNLTGEN